MPPKTSFVIPYLTILNSKQVFQNARKNCIATSVQLIFQPIFILQSEIQKTFFFLLLYSLGKQNHLTKLCHFRHVRFTISFHNIVSQFLHSLVFMLELNTTHKRHQSIICPFIITIPTTLIQTVDLLAVQIISQYKSQLCKCTSQISRLLGHKK